MLITFHQTLRFFPSSSGQAGPSNALYTTLVEVTELCDDIREWTVSPVESADSQDVKRNQSPSPFTERASQDSLADNRSINPNDIIFPQSDIHLSINACTPIVEPSSLLLDSDVPPYRDKRELSSLSLLTSSSIEESSKKRKEWDKEPKEEKKLIKKRRKLIGKRFSGYMAMNQRTSLTLNYDL